MALNGFNVLLFVPAAPVVLAEIKTAFCPLILRLELSRNAIENIGYCDLRPHYIILQIRKGNELTGQKS